MDEHPDLKESELAALQRGELPLGVRGFLVALHLRFDCAVCRARWGDRLAPVLDPSWPGDEPDRASKFDEQRVDFAIRKAFLAVRKRRPEIAAALAQVESELLGTAALEGGRLPRSTPPLQWARAQEWLEEARACRREAPEEYEVFASLAAAYALRLEAKHHPKGEAADLQALALAEAANAHRRAGRFPAAEALFSEATAKTREGTREHPVTLEIVRLFASLSIDRRQFGEAVVLLRRTYLGYEALGRRHEAGEQAAVLGRVYQYMGQPALSLEIYLEALERIDGEREPTLAVATVHNVLRAYLEMEEWPAAERLFPRAAILHERFGTPLDRLKLEGLRARLLAGQGRVLQAGRAYEDLIAEFERRSQFAESALLRLELAELY